MSLASSGIGWLLGGVAVVGGAVVVTKVVQARQEAAAAIGQPPATAPQPADKITAYPPMTLAELKANYEATRAAALAGTGSYGAYAKAKAEYLAAGGSIGTIVTDASQGAAGAVLHTVQTTVYKDPIPQGDALGLRDFFQNLLFGDAGQDTNASDVHAAAVSQALFPKAPGVVAKQLAIAQTQLAQKQALLAKVQARYDAAVAKGDAVHMKTEMVFIKRTQAEIDLINQRIQRLQGA